MFLKDYLQYEKYKKTEKQGSREAEKQVSKEAGKSRKAKRREAEMQRSRETEIKQKTKWWGKNRPPQYNTAYGYLHWEFNQQ